MKLILDKPNVIRLLAIFNQPVNPYIKSQDKILRSDATLSTLCQGFQYRVGATLPPGADLFVL